jgi:hypothetical protein
MNPVIEKLAVLYIKERKCSKLGDWQSKLKYETMFTYTVSPIDDLYPTYGFMFKPLCIGRSLENEK